MNDQLSFLDESARWRSRDVTYVKGSWQAIMKEIPLFELCEFRHISDGPANSFMKSVVRQPLHEYEQQIPVGVVSNTYNLVQHKDIAALCVKALSSADVDVNEFQCELGLSELGEWMNFRIYLSDDYSFTDVYGEKLGLRLECFNTVDGSSRLVIIFGWLRFVCSNGMVIGETKIEIRDIHKQSLNLEQIPIKIEKAMRQIETDRNKLSGWQKTNIAIKSKYFTKWINKEVTYSIGKKAACRIYHICQTGADVELIDPFEKGDASEKKVIRNKKVPGMPYEAKTLYDVSQALSWVATQRNNPEEKLEWQSKIPILINKLAA